MSVAEWLAQLRRWGAEVLDPRACQSFRARLTPRMDELDKGGLSSERQAHKSIEWRLRVCPV